MIKREDVEALLRMTGHFPVIDIDSPTLAELCRTWLAVDAAQEVTVPKLQVHTGLPKERWKPHAIELPRELAGQRVKLVLVPEADSGGDRG